MTIAGKVALLAMAAFAAIALFGLRPVRPVENVDVGLVKPPQPQPQPTKKYVLSWAPSVDADAYRLILFEGDDVAWDQRTSLNQMMIDVPPGNYRWVVLPLVDGTEDFPALVDSPVVIPAG